VRNPVHSGAPPGRNTPARGRRGSASSPLGPDQRACAAESAGPRLCSGALRRAVGSRGCGFSPQTNAVADPDFAQLERPNACSRPHLRWL
jgi:hypothetical protein